MPRSRFDPRLQVEFPPTNGKAPERAVLLEALKRLAPLFKDPPLVRIRWGHPEGLVEVVSVARGYTLVVHPALASERLPDDVRDAAVFLGLLLVRAAKAQRRLVGHVLDRPELVAWVEGEMALHPAAAMLAKFFERFGIWAKGP